MRRRKGRGRGRWSRDSKTQCLKFISTCSQRFPTTAALRKFSGIQPHHQGCQPSIYKIQLVATPKTPSHAHPLRHLQLC
ncbi:hypothetical protein AAZX31_07G160200 [Glycine max]